MTVDLDEILQELGQLGRYQVHTYMLLCLSVMFMAISGMSYVFTAGDMNYRCHVPECDNNETQPFHPDWLYDVVPSEERSGVHLPSRCLRFEYANESSSVERTSNETCLPERFRNTTTRCDKWVFDGDESTILNEWDLTCQENHWKLSLVGTANSVGCLISIPVIGCLSDRFGRKTLFLWSLALKCIIGFSRSFAQDYITFVALEFLCVVVGAGIYAVIFILAMEVVGPDKRVLGGIIINGVDSLGTIMLGFVALWTQDWRLMLRVVYIPVLVFIPYYWLLQESVRWLLVKGRVKEAETILMKAAETNRVKLSEGVVKKLELAAEEEMAKERNESLSYFKVLQQVLRSKVLLLRLVLCSFCWATNTLVYYGLSLNSVTLTGSKHYNFILVTVAELPGVLICYFTMQRYGRKLSMCVPLFISGACCVAFIFIPADFPWVLFVLFLLGKMTITMSFVSLYAFTAEIFPTELRNSLFGTCSMVGRFGSIAASQTNTLAQYMSTSPLILFGSLAAIAALLSLLFPETKGTKMPDTVQESVDINKNTEDIPSTNCSNVTSNTETESSRV